MMRVTSLVLAMAFATATALGAHAAETLIDLNARDIKDAAWPNKGTMGGSFAAVGSPAVNTVAGVVAVTLNGTSDAFRGPISPDSLNDNAPRTIEVWAYNTSADTDEKVMVSWGKRGGPAGTLMGFGWGRNNVFGAATHWAADMPWTSLPRLNRWHYLVYTFDGSTARIYDNGVPKGERGSLRLATASGQPVLIGAETSAIGELQFTNEFTRQPLGAALSIATVRISSGAISVDEIEARFTKEANSYQAKRSDAETLLHQGTTSVQAGPMTLTLLNATQTAVSLSPDGGQFDFLPGDRIAQRANEKYYHLGDLTLKTRVAGEERWRSYSSAARAGEIVPIADPAALSACDLTPNLGTDCPLRVERRWVNENGRLALRFKIINPGNQPVEVGAFGAAMVFNNLITGRTLDDTHTRCAFATPAVNADAGYLQVTRLNGQGPALLVIPQKGTSFEAYRPLYDDPTPQSVTFEGFYEWMTRSAAYAQNEWKDAARNWNEPTAVTLSPGESTEVGYRFVTAPSIKAIESTLIEQKRPVAVGIPGYVVTTDVPAKLFLNYGRQGVKSFSVEPAGALEWKINDQQTPHGWRPVELTAKTPGACRLSVIYDDGTRQTIPYFVLSPEAEQVVRFGKFLETKQWFTDKNDPFKRTNSWLPFDRRSGKMLTQHPHTWFVGLSDEIGAGPSVGMALKNEGMPTQSQVDQLEQYVDTALYGNLQNKDFSVKASLFFFQPSALPDFKYTVNEGWDKARGETTWRSFNYPHVTAVYWSLYRLSRDHTGLTTRHKWDYYLDHAYQTARAMQKFAPEYTKFGLMVGSVFPDVVRDLRNEGWTEKADALESEIKDREEHWRSLKYPFGSEMPWDSTGQEEIYAWCRYFGADDKAQVTIDAITGYMPAVPNWAYNGAARRYFDAMVNGNAWPEIVQNTNHYGSSLNALPVLDAYRRDPADLYLLRIGYAGMNQVLCNIDPSGFASYGFNTDPQHLDFDPLTADYGIAFYGYARGAGTYVVQDPEFGWLGFGGMVRTIPDGVEVEPRDAFRRRLFFAPAKLWITLDVGQIERATWNAKTREITLTLSPGTDATPTARLQLETPGSKSAGYAVEPKPSVERGAFSIQLGKQTKTIKLVSTASKN